MVDDRKSPQIASTYWDLYFAPLWWVFAAAATIGIILIAGLYYEHVTGMHLVDWCSTTCAMIGGLVLVLLIMVAHLRDGDRENIDITKRELNALEARLQLLEETTDLVERNENSFVVFMYDRNPKGDSDD